MKLPAEVNYILETLVKHNYSAYVVGGAVRDYLLHQKPLDYDIATSALPNQIKEIFSPQKLVLTGEKYGTIGIVLKHQLFQVTTFRADGKYRDYRFPEKVEFLTDLKGDLARRDFTINALAYHDQQIVDYFAGQADLQAHLIRTVGQPAKRFQEDALRILRALRFKSKLAFQIEAETYQAMLAHQNLLPKLSEERRAIEFKQIICGKNVKNVLKEDLPILIKAYPWLDYVAVNDLLIVPNYLVRIVSLTKRICLREFPRVAKSLGLSNQDIKTLIQVRKHLLTKVETKRDLKLILNSLSHVEYDIWLANQSESNQKKINSLLDKIIANRELVFKRDLQLTGQDLLALAIPEAYRQTILNELYHQVISGKVLNEPASLSNLAQEILKELTK